MLPLSLLLCSFHLLVGWYADVMAGAEAVNLDHEVTLGRESMNGRETFWRRLGLLGL